MADSFRASTMQIRDAQADDIEAIVVIYNHAVLHTLAIWNETPVDAANRLIWLQSRGEAGYPVLVAVDENDEVIGYASFGDWRAFDGYRFTIEHSVYVRCDCYGRGIGKALMVILIERARACGKHVMVAAVEAGNVASIGLHKKLGFKEVGRMNQVGAKFGQWMDLIFLQLQLDSRGVPDVVTP